MPIKTDNIGDLSLAIGDARYLKLDQTTPQTVLNGQPVFDSGTKNNDNIILKAGKYLILDGA